MADDVLTGFVGLFDVLGYQSLMEELPPKTAAGIMISAVAGPQAQARQAVQAAFKRAGAEVLNADAVANLKWFVFSDSILLMCPHGPDRDSQLSAAIVHCHASIVCYRAMLDAGLPVRGAVGHGEYFMAESCFAGTPIVDAYRLGQRMDLAAIALHSSAEAMWTDFGPAPVGGVEWIDLMSLRHLTPMRGGGSEVLRLLHPAMSGPGEQPIEGNIRDAVMASFLAHKKQMTPDVMRKADQTEVFFRRAAQADQGMFTKGG